MRHFRIIFGSVQTCMTVSDCVGLLFDTHAFMWLDSAVHKLSQYVIDHLNTSLETRILSTVVPWEMRIKASLGKLELRGDLKTIVQEQIQHNRLVVLPVTLEHVYALAELDTHHKDPFDRLLIAQARVEGHTIITSDPMIQRYDVPTLWQPPT